MSNELFNKKRLFELLNISSKKDLAYVSNQLKISSAQLKYYNDQMICPTGEELSSIAAYVGTSELEIQLRLGIISCEVADWISQNPKCILSHFESTNKKSQMENIQETAVFTTDFGKLFNCDCLNLLSQMADNSVDLIFADPPFNLGKDYGFGFNDAISEQEYLKWTERWLTECVRVLKPGGAFFVYNIPLWATYTSSILNRYLNFRHWIAIYMRGLMPVQNKLHPSHYGLLYYIKGDKPKTFNQQRIPMSTCRHCGGEIHDYGGKKRGLNPDGLCIADVWTDINPVRHKKYKNRVANELPLNLLHRVISLASNEGDVVFDPFGGSGTTYVVAEYLKRQWIGAEIGDTSCIVERIEQKRDIEHLNTLEKNSNVMFTDAQVKLRKKNGFWAYEILENSTDA